MLLRVVDRRGALAVMLALAALLGACGGDDDDDAGDGGGGGEADRQDYVDAFTEASNDAESGMLSTEEETCFAEGLVDSIGVSRLAAAVTPDDIRDQATTNLADLGVEVDEDDGAAIYQEISRCADVRTLLIESTLGTDAVDAEVTRCFDERLDEELVRQFMVAGLSERSDEFQRSEVFGQLRDIFSVCTPQ
jgi:hypothetical protein